MRVTDPEYGETWVYEGIIGALLGIDLGPRVALAIQFLLFETAVLLLAWWYDLWTAAVAGTVAVAVATVGSAELLRIARRIRGEEVPAAYRRLLFVSNVEVVLSVLVVYLMLLILWDVCYRIGAGWWASVLALWRSLRYRFDDRTRGPLRRIDLETAGFGVVQLAFVPFLLDQPVLLLAVVGHVVAVTVVTGLSLVALSLRTAR